MADRHMRTEMCIYTSRTALNISAAIALATGAHGGIGPVSALEFFQRAAWRAYAAALNPALQATNSDRVVTIKLDVSEVAPIGGAVKTAHDANLAVNNAGLSGKSGTPVSITDAALDCPADSVNET